MNWLEEYRQKKAERKEREVRERAEILYQICEHDNALWLTYNDNLICPCSYLKEDAVVAVNVMRKMYVERNSKNE